MILFASFLWRSCWNHRRGPGMILYRSLWEDLVGFLFKSSLKGVRIKFWRLEACVWKFFWTDILHIFDCCEFFFHVLIWVPVRGPTHRVARIISHLQLTAFISYCPHRFGTTHLQQFSRNGEKINVLATWRAHSAAISSATVSSSDMCWAFTKSCCECHSMLVASGFPSRLLIEFRVCGLNGQDVTPVPQNDGPSPLAVPTLDGTSRRTVTNDCPEGWRGQKIIIQWNLAIAQPFHAIPTYKLLWS